LEDRDTQEVVGYFNTMDIISQFFEVINITENELKNLHNILLKHSQKDDWHRGDYKKHSNAVEMRQPDGSTQIIFRTTEVGVPTQDAMRRLVRWYRTDDKTHPLVKCALFTYEFVSIYPFQDGNGRLSRLLSTLLLLKNNYKWIEYVSFEHEIESRKSEYYRVLRSCQSQRPNENVNEWLVFFLDALRNIQEQLIAKLDFQGIKSQFSSRDKSVLTYIEIHPGCKSSDMVTKLGITKPTLKRILSDLLDKNLIQKFGIGSGTNYSVK
jgi:Fic family protein